PKMTLWRRSMSANFWANSSEADETSSSSKNMACKLMAAWAARKVSRMRSVLSRENERNTTSRFTSEVLVILPSAALPYKTTDRRSSEYAALAAATNVERIVATFAETPSSWRPLSSAIFAFLRTSSLDQADTENAIVFRGVWQRNSERTPCLFAIGKFINHSSIVNFAFTRTTGLGWVTRSASNSRGVVHLLAMNRLTMNKLTARSVLALLFLIVSSGLAAFAASTDPVHVQQGLLSGSAGTHPDVRVYRGIPFAAPPVGDLRWKAPQPPASWQGTREGKEFGNACPQTAYPGGSIYTSKLPTLSEDCLY